MSSMVGEILGTENMFCSGTDLIMQFACLQKKHFDAKWKFSHAGMAMLAVAV